MSSNSPDRPASGATAGFGPVPDAVARLAVRRWWDDNARDYAVEHGDFLGPADFCWGPEGLREADAHLLGDVVGRRVLEIGAGAAQCSRWLARQGAEVVASDVSAGMLAESRRLDVATCTVVPLLQADARALPLAPSSFDVVFTAYGALPFVPDPWRVHEQVARVLRPGGLWAFSTSHPIRWAFPDDPGPAGLTAMRSYFDRTPYVETGDDGAVEIAEFHRTLADHVGDVVRAGLTIERVLEPEWPAGHDGVWGGWSPLRGELLPGTLVVVCRRR